MEEREPTGSPRTAPDPGVLAPAQAYGPAGFLDALVPYGITWSIETSPYLPMD